MVIKNLLDQANTNEYFRKVLATNKSSQLVIMSLLPNEEIGEEVHDLDQILYITKGTGQAFLDGEVTEISAGDVINVPEGVKHNIVNTGQQSLKLATVYSPPEHPDGTIHKTKAEAEAAEHH